MSSLRVATQGRCIAYGNAEMLSEEPDEGCAAITWPGAPKVVREEEASVGLIWASLENAGRLDVKYFRQFVDRSPMHFPISSSLTVSRENRPRLPF